MSRRVTYTSLQKDIITHELGRVIQDLGQNQTLKAIVAAYDPSVSVSFVDIYMQWGMRRRIISRREETKPYTYTYIIRNPNAPPMVSNSKPEPEPEPLKTCTRLASEHGLYRVENSLKTEAYYILEVLRENYQRLHQGDILERFIQNHVNKLEREDREYIVTRARYIRDFIDGDDRDLFPDVKI